MAKRKAKVISSQKDLDEILNITHERACEKSLIMDWFGDFGDGPRFNPYDIITIPKNKYGSNKKNKDEFKTTIGLWVFNKSFIEPMSDVLGYINHTIDGDAYDDINIQLSYALLEDKITLDQLKHFIMQTQIVMGCASAICPSHTMDMLLIDSKAQTKRHQLEKQYKEQLEQQDLKAMKAIEDSLIDWAKEELKDSESVDMYNSGARSKWGNNFKNMYLLRSAVKGTDNHYTYISNSYIEGMDPKDYATINDAAVGGPYSRARKTQEGGYLEKQFTNATQHLKIQKKGSDCGTKRHITIRLDESNIDTWMYSFVIQPNGSLVEITTENKYNFINKTVKLRYSGLCEAKNGYICEACAGTMCNRIGIERVGLSSMIMASSLKNASMSKFHSMNLSLITLKPDEIF